MKKKLLILFAITTVLSTGGMAQLNLYGGLNFAGASTKDFVKFDISDWQNYGLLSENPGSAEGRVTIDLTKVKPSSINPGLYGGLSYNLNEKFAVLGELQLDLSSLSLFSAYLGFNYDISQSEKFNLGICPKVGYNAGSTDLGAIDVLPGYTPPVILPEGTFNNGDKLSMNFSGIAINIGLKPQLKINDNISLIGLLGYNISFVKTDGLLCNGVALPMTAPGIVKSDGSARQAAICPKITSNGLSLQFGLSIKIG